MNTQTFRAPDMMAALETIQNQLGPRAVVLSVREVFDESCWKIWKRPGVEVLAALDQEIPDQAISKPAVQHSSKQLSGAVQDPPIEPTPGSSPTVYDRNLSRFQTQERPAAASSNSVMREIREELALQDVISPFRDQLIETCREVFPPQVLQDRFRIGNFIQDLIEAEIEVLPEAKVGGRKVICLIGSGGSGKTSTAAKLAAVNQQNGKHPVVWISADTVRAGAIAETRAYTDNLQIPFYKAYTPEELGGLIHELREDALVLVDFFDCNPHRNDQVKTLATYLEKIPQRDTYLVLSASTKVADLVSAVQTFKPLNVDGLISTKLDETQSYGNLISAIWKSQIPLVYTTSGSKITDPLHKPDPHILVENLFRIDECYL